MRRQEGKSALPAVVTGHLTRALSQWLVNLSLMTGKTDLSDQEEEEEEEDERKGLISLRHCASCAVNEASHRDISCGCVLCVTGRPARGEEEKTFFLRLLL